MILMPVFVRDVRVGDHIYDGLERRWSPVIEVTHNAPEVVVATDTLIMYRHPTDAITIQREEQP